MKYVSPFAVSVLFAIVLFVPAIRAAGQQPAPVDAKKHQETVKKAVTYLFEKGQNRDDGSFSKQLSPAVTAICAYALMRNGVEPTEKHVAAALRFLASNVKPDGGIYSKDSVLQNYETSIGVMAFQAANKDHQYDDVIANAVAFLKKIQWDDEEGHSLSSPFFGGQGYGSGKRPDASNTAFFIEALKEAGQDPSSQGMQNAITFMNRCQNLPSADNVSDWSSKVSDEDHGGFIYSPANNGESKAGKTPEGGLRSYASMTYTGLKSFLYAGVKKDDLRVKAAMDWIRRHYDLKSNPGMGEEGLYYYYHVFAKALAAAGDRHILDSQGISHNWRADLVNELASRQREDGSWVNASDRWYEGDPNLVTAYSLLALSYASPAEDK